MELGCVCSEVSVCFLVNIAHIDFLKFACLTLRTYRHSVHLVPRRSSEILRRTHSPCYCSIYHDRRTPLFVSLSFETIQWFARPPGRSVSQQHHGIKPSCHLGRRQHIHQITTSFSRSQKQAILLQRAVSADSRRRTERLRLFRWYQA
jgi:hypothetical protein